jgi:DNA polymerase V
MKTVTTEALAPQWLALVDANNFFASCEQAADPSLRGRPVGVLSSNDGCIIARSAELKALDIPMGVPVFQVRDLLDKHGVVLRSADFAFYRDMSARLMDLLIADFPQVEVYSVDEAFLNLTALLRYLDVEARLQASRLRIWEALHIPVSIGVGPSKVLAKLANRIAKRQGTGLYTWPADPQAAQAVLQATPTHGLWGIAGRLARRMAQHGVHTAWELAQLPGSGVRQQWGMPVHRMWHELHGRSMMPVTDAPTQRKSILASRSFAHDVRTLPELEAAISWFVLCCAQKLVAQHMGASRLAIFLRTNRHKQGPQYRPYLEVALPEPTGYPPTLQHHALEALRQVYRPGYRYKKAGVLLWDFAPLDARQASLFVPSTPDKRLRVLHTVHRLNADKGQRQVAWASFQKYERLNAWRPRSEHLEHHQTDWQAELPATTRQRARVWYALDEGTL